MPKRVVVIASGDTERAALSHLLREIQDAGVVLSGVRTPPRHRALTPGSAWRIARAAWFETVNTEERATKFVVPVDADSENPDDVEAEFAARFLPKVADLDATFFVRAAKWHPEAWFFADPQGLRTAIGGRELGALDAVPDDILRPKLRLQHLLAPNLYTARTAGGIASELSLAAVRRSPSFARFEQAARNGPDTAE